MPAPHLAEFVSAYMAEVDEHLSVANSSLLAVEASIRKGEPNLRGVREVFRALHTIKGLSAMVGVEPVVVLAHHMEALLRSTDRSGASLPLSAIDVLLQGARAIEARVQAYGEGRSVQPPPASLLAEIDTFDTLSPRAAASALALLEIEPELSAKLGPVELEHLQKALAAGKRALCASFEPTAEKAKAGVSIKVVREAIEKLGDIVKVIPIARPEAGAGLSFAIVLVTSGTDDELSAAVEGGLVIKSLAEPVAQVAQPLVGDTDAEDLELQPDAPQQGFVRVDVARLDETVERLSALIVNRFRMNRAIARLAEAGADVREVTQIQSENGRQLRDLRGAIFRVRMVPIAELLDRIPLLVRGLCRSVDRRVRVEIDAGKTEVDKVVAERLFPALVHLVRNAVDHAIESPDERLRRGKAQEGVLRISCTARADTWLELVIEDDGRGIDREAVARKAQRNVPGSDAALLELLCTPGLSTREIATTTSGRGMGMEIVKRGVEALGGELSLRTELRVGTAFVLRVPLSLSIVEAFTFECAAQRFVVPVGSVDEIIEVEEAEVAPSPQPEHAPLRVSMVERRGRIVPLLGLAEVLHLGQAPRGKKALIVRRGESAIAFAVDRMLGQQEVVVRPLEDALLQVPGVAGATDLGDGRPTLVLDLVGLGARLERQSARQLA